jgi:D-3-phosphoglycerate dehydrogenase
MPRVLITTVPFGQKDPAPLRLLESAGLDYTINPIGRRLTEPELAAMIPGVEWLVAGTEPIGRQVMAAADKLKLISRVGIGLDNVDLLDARRRGIAVAYTPDGPSPAVAELTVGLMLNLLRGIHHAHAGAQAGQWDRIMGRRLSEVTVGVIGVGRIGRRVIDLLAPFGGRILAHDLAPSDVPHPRVEWTDFDRIAAESDVLSIHVPLTGQTRGLVDAAVLRRMKRDAVLVNTARGGIVDEAALAEALRAGEIAGAAVDVFQVEPYAGELTSVKNCLVTCHMGSMSEDCRFRMEYDAVSAVVRFARGESVDLVPASEYALRELAPGA